MCDFNDTDHDAVSQAHLKPRVTLDMYNMSRRKPLPVVRRTRVNAARQWPRGLEWRHSISKHRLVGVVTSVSSLIHKGSASATVAD